MIFILKRRHVRVPAVVHTLRVAQAHLKSCTRIPTGVRRLGLALLALAGPASGSLSHARSASESATPPLQPLAVEGFSATAWAPAP